MLMTESEEKLVDKLIKWKHGFEEKGLKVNVGKIKVMKSTVESVITKETGKFPCSICKKGVGRNSVLCIKCIGSGYTKTAVV